MIYSSAVFGGGNVKLEAALRKPNQYREAVIYENLGGLPDDKLDEFIKSDEAKMMVDREIISDDTLDRLKEKRHHKHSKLDLTVCHMAKEADDPLWNDLVKCRIQERRIMNELLEKYGKEASRIADKADKDFVQKFVPEYFRNGHEDGHGHEDRHDHHDHHDDD